MPHAVGAFIIQRNRCAMLFGKRLVFGFHLLTHHQKVIGSPKTRVFKQLLQIFFARLGKSWLHEPNIFNKLLGKLGHGRVLALLVQDFIGGLVLRVAKRCVLFKLIQ